MHIFDESELRVPEPAENEAEVEREAPRLVRLSVNLNLETAEALKTFADSRGISFTEAVRRMISISTFIDEELESGRKVQIVDERRNKVRELELY